MLAKKGSVSYSVVLQSLINLKEPNQKFYKTILLNSNIKYVITLMTQIIKEQPVTPLKSKRLSDV